MADVRPAVWAFATASVLALVTLSMPTTSQADPAEPLWRVDDPLGDVRPAALVSPDAGGVPPGTYADPYDLVAVEVAAEDPLLLTFDVAVADMSGLPRVLNAGDEVAYGLRFSLEGSPVTYAIEGHFQGWTLGLAAAGEGEETAEGFLWYCMESEGSTSCYGGFDFIRIRAVLSEAVVRFEVPKNVLVGAVDQIGGSMMDALPRTISAGDKLTELTGYAVASPAIIVFPGASVGFRDQAPDASADSPPYSLAHSLANRNLRLTSVFADGPTQLAFEAGEWTQHPWMTHGGSVVAGTEASISVTVENPSDRKQLVNLTSEVPAEDRDAWSVRIVPTLEVPPRSTRTVAVHVNASDSLAHRDQTTVTVRATSLSRPTDIGLVRVAVRAAHEPTTNWESLRIHVESHVSEGGLACPETPRVCETFGASWLNGLEDDPVDTTGPEGAPMAPWLVAPSLGDSTVVLRTIAPMDVRPTSSFLLDAGRPVHVEVAVSTEAPLDVDLEANLVMGDYASCLADSCQWGQNRLVATGTASATLGPDPTVIAVDLVVDPAMALVDPAEGVPALTLVARSDSPAAAAVSLAGVRLHPEQSRLDWSIEPVGQAESGQAGLGLYAQGSREDYLNPGGTRLFNFLLVNEGTDPVQVAVEAAVQPSSWNVTVLPSEAYQIGPGQTVNATLSVEAPRTANEGDTARVTVTARPVDGDASATLDYAAIATQGVQLADEADAYEEDPDAVAKAIDLDEGGDSPGPGSAFVVGATVFVALFVRRRPRSVSESA